MNDVIAYVFIVPLVVSVWAVAFLIVDLTMFNGELSEKLADKIRS